jgi:hypothetical protein
MGLITSTISAKEEVPVLASIDVLGVYLAARCSPHNRFTVTTPCPEKLRTALLRPEPSLPSVPVHDPDVGSVPGTD